MTIHTEIEEGLEDILPHGSGIDSYWMFERNGEDIIAYNTFHYMDGESGMYLGWIPFEVRLNYDEASGGFSLAEVLLDEDDVEDMIAASLEGLRDTIAYNIDAFTDMPMIELTSDDLDVLVDDVDQIYDILEQHGYDDSGADKVIENSSPNFTDDDADMLVDHLYDVIRPALSDADFLAKGYSPKTFSRQGVVAKTFKATRIGSTASGTDLTEEDGYHYVQNDGDVLELVSEAMGLESIHGYSDGELEDATHAIVKIGNAEYDEIWLTWDSRWFEAGTEYELVFTQDALHEWIRNQKR